MEIHWVLLASALLLAILALRWQSARLVARTEAAVPPEGQFLDLDGRRLHYVEEGEGPSLVMIHGLTGNGRNLTHSLMPALRREFRVMVLDRPGAGYSDSAPELADLHGQAAVVARFIAAKGLQRPLVLGHSLGGAIALTLALDHPQRVRGLILVAPLTHPQPLPPLVFLSLAVRPDWLRRLVAGLFATPVGHLGSAQVLRQIFSPDPLPADFPTRGGALLGMRPASFYAASRELALVNHHLRLMVPAYASLRLPVGLIHGTRDRILDYRRHAEAMRQHIPGLILEPLEGRGHMLPVVAVDPVVALVRRIDAQAGAPNQDERRERCGEKLHIELARSNGQV